MEPSCFSRNFGTGRRALARLGTGPMLVLLLAGLLTEVVNHEEAYAGIDYALLMLLGATGCIVTLTGRLVTGLGPMPWAAPPFPAPGPSAPSRGLPAAGEDWPLLVSLLFGTILVLISGLGGWV